MAMQISELVYVVMYLIINKQQFQHSDWLRTSQLISGQCQ